MARLAADMRRHLLLAFPNLFDGANEAKGRRGVSRACVVGNAQPIMQSLSIVG